jgi:YggT family protein
MYTPPVPIVSDLVQVVIGVLILAMLIRAIASWFNLDERYAFIRVLARVTDPFIMPIRRVIGQVWVLDLSFFVAWFLLFILESLLRQSLPPGW